MKKFIVLFLCLTILMTNQAFSMDEETDHPKTHRKHLKKHHTVNPLDWHEVVGLIGFAVIGSKFIFEMAYDAEIPALSFNNYLDLFPNIEGSVLDPSSAAFIDVACVEQL